MDRGPVVHGIKLIRKKGKKGKKREKEEKRKFGLRLLVDHSSKIYKVTENTCILWYYLL
jgi:hypothetical protein